MSSAGGAVNPCVPVLPSATSTQHREDPESVHGFSGQRSQPPQVHDPVSTDPGDTPTQYALVFDPRREIIKHLINNGNTPQSARTIKEALLSSYPDAGKSIGNTLSNNSKSTKPDSPPLFTKKGSTPFLYALNLGAEPQLLKIITDDSLRNELRALSTHANHIVSDHNGSSSLGGTTRPLPDCAIPSKSDQQRRETNGAQISETWTELFDDLEACKSRINRNSARYAQHFDDDTSTNIDASPDANAGNNVGEVQLTRPPIQSLKDFKEQTGRLGRLGEKIASVEQDAGLHDQLLLRVRELRECVEAVEGIIEGVVRSLRARAKDLTEEKTETRAEMARWLA